MYRVLVADPPWAFDDKLPGPGRGAEKHYGVLSVSDICQFELPPLADDCYLFMWRVSAMVEEAYRVVRAWGFTPKSEIVWLKRTALGKRWFGMGRHVRAEHETCIVAVRGRPQVKRRDVRSTFEALAERVHSRKPEAFFELVESLVDGPYVELFARRQRPGWTCLGNEVGQSTDPVLSYPA
jgi:N6-adenosine-specific RNA methylase IME4